MKKIISIIIIALVVTLAIVFFGKPEEKTQKEIEKEVEEEMITTENAKIKNDKKLKNILTKIKSYILIE